MRELFQQYAIHLDDLRKEAGIRTIDFCEDVCDDRTFRRYLSGSIIMTQDKLNKFCEKLGISINEFMVSYDQTNDDYYNDIVQAISAFGTDDFEFIKKKLRVLENANIQSPLNRQLYEYLIIKYQLRTKQITETHAFEMYSNLINYPTCLEKKHFVASDIYTLRELQELERNKGKRTVQNFLYDLLLHRDHIFLTYHERAFLPILYQGVALAFGRDGDDSRVLQLSTEGLKVSKKNFSTESIDRLYYLQSLAYHNLGDDNAAFISARKALSASIAKDDITYFKRLLWMYEKDFKINTFELLHVTDIKDLFHDLECD